MSQNAIVNILNKHHISIGTGFFVSAEGYIITCSHVIKGSDVLFLNKENKQSVYFKTTDTLISER